MWPNSQFPADLVTFTEEFLNGKLHFLCGVICPFQIQYDDGTIDWLGLLHVTYWWYLYSLNILKDTSFHFSIDMRYYSVALIKSHRFLQTCPVNQLCVTHWSWSPIYFAIRTQWLCELSVGFGIVSLQGRL